MRTGLGRGGEFGEEDTFAKVDTTLLGRAIILKTSGAWNFKMPKWQWVELVLRVFFVRCHRRGREAFPGGEICSLSLPVLKQRLGIWMCQCRTLHVLLILRQEGIQTSQWIAYPSATQKGRQCFSALCFFRGGSDGKESACNAGDMGSLPGSGRSLEKRIATPLQYSCLENPMDRGAW